MDERPPHPDTRPRARSLTTASADIHIELEQRGAPIDNAETDPATDDVLSVLETARAAAVCASRRPLKISYAPTVADRMLIALTACVRRSCGLSSTTSVGQFSSAITATVVGDPLSRSRAIALRYGGTKRDAVLWVSSRGGLMCSCFNGTQNALFLSASSRSTD